MTNSNFLYNENAIKLYSEKKILIYHWDKLKNIIYKYYKTGELKSIKYIKENIFTIYTKNGKSINDKIHKTNKHEFLKNNYLDLISENDEDIQEMIFDWFWDLNRKDFKVSMEILNNLIASENHKIKVKAIEIAGANYFEKCIKQIEKELSNYSKVYIEKDFHQDDFSTFDSSLTVSDLASKSISRIRSKKGGF
ncbi:hypothetical protein [Aureivirga sp. CE67]|uniref:hypothetical protein n=1 Tax=Aureivirga sp. CE67 TaxID=1788983 RepID=UPI0018C93BCC|nr:hypothetical protein [Aureivirga sp. CE67]